MIELTIDGIKVQTREGMNILDAAKENNIYIPNLCWDRRLKPYGGCRLCVVQVEGRRKLMSSCSTPAENGMVVHTNTPSLIKARKAVLELLLVLFLARLQTLDLDEVLVGLRLEFAAEGQSDRRET